MERFKYSLLLFSSKFLNSDKKLFQIFEIIVSPSDGLGKLLLISYFSISANLSVIDGLVFFSFPLIPYCCE